jgi:2-polyprenyl-3-methyl-5-hydroxy-6-metoxy-1,4-benzoquinol methylase
MTDFAELHVIAKGMSAGEWCQLWTDFAGRNKVAVALPEMPPDDIQKITNNLAGAATMKAAATFYMVADGEIEARFPAGAPRRLLDYGAGWGRITRLLLRSVPPRELHAVDVDERLVERAKKSLPGIHVELIKSYEELPFSDASFDIIIVNSVLSHLSMGAHLFCINELARLLRSGGLLIATTLGLRHLDTWLADEKQRSWITGIVGEDARERLLRGEFVFGSTRRWPDYGTAFLPQGWVAAHWRSKFPVLTTRPDYSPQDLHLAIRR